jgi:hypothetical protein
MLGASPRKVASPETGYGFAALRAWNEERALVPQTHSLDDAEFGRARRVRKVDKLHFSYWHRIARSFLLTYINPKFILFVAFAGTLLASGLMQKRAVDKWTQSTGRAPLIQTGRGSWTAYMRQNKFDMPDELLKVISIWSWVGRAALLAFGIILFFVK